MTDYKKKEVSWKSIDFHETKKRRKNDMLKEELLHQLNHSPSFKDEENETLLKRYARLKERIEKAFEALPTLNLEGLSLHQTIDELAFQMYKLYFETQGEQGDYFLARELISSISYPNLELGYRILSELYKPFRVCDTYADVGSVLIGTDDFQFRISDLSGDGHKSVYYIDSSAFGQQYHIWTDIPLFLGDSFNVKKSINVYEYDCDTDTVAYQLQSGEYVIYKNGSHVLFVRIGEFNNVER